MANLRTTFLIVILASLLGCSSLDSMSLFKRSNFVEAGPNNPVIDVVCLWEPAEGRGLDNLPTRGFAGQLLFLTRGTAEPAKVDGEVRIYLFDDQGTSEEQSKPIHQFDFKGGTFTQYLCETNMGAAYQIFIPYPRKGTHEARCALRVRYLPEEGGAPVYSKMASLTLLGAKPKETVDSWRPQRRQLRPGDESLAGELTVNDSRATPASTGSIQITSEQSTARRAKVSSAHARLQQVAAQIAHEAEVITPAEYESSEDSPRRFQLNN